MHFSVPVTVLAALAWAASPQTCGAKAPSTQEPPSAQSHPLEGAPCRFEPPQGWESLTAPTGSLQVAEERFERPNVVVRSRLELKEPKGGTLEQGLERARMEELEALGQKPAFELVRDAPLRGGRLNGHQLVYRYQTAPDGPAVLRYHAVFTTGFRVVEVVGDSQATVIDALELPNREAGLHEMWMRPALLSLQCSR